MHRATSCIHAATTSLIASPPTCEEAEDGWRVRKAASNSGCRGRRTTETGGNSWFPALSLSAYLSPRSATSSLLRRSRSTPPLSSATRSSFSRLMNVSCTNQEFHSIIKNVSNAEIRGRLVQLQAHTAHPTPVTHDTLRIQGLLSWRRHNSRLWMCGRWFATCARLC